MTKSKIEQGEADAKKPINCATAVQDIQRLESEKANVEQQAIAGAQSVIPVSAVMNILERNELNELEVGGGEYNRMIDEKIAEIKKECKIK